MSGLETIQNLPVLSWCDLNAIELYPNLVTGCGDNFVGFVDDRIYL